MRRTILGTTLLATLTATGCASSRGARAPAPPEVPEIAPSVVAPEDGPGETTEAPPRGDDEAEPSIPPGESVDLTPPESASVSRRRGVAAPCEAPVLGADARIDRARRRLYETTCSAALWFDGLFGESGDVAAARDVYGRVELSLVESEFHGVERRTKLNVRVKLPTMEERLEAFVGREDQEEFIQDRNEGFALRTQFPGLEQDEDWIAGLGYGLPGDYRKRTDFRVGGKISTAPEIFAQARHKRNWFVGTRNLLHARGTLFWTNRDGFGTTNSFDYDRVLTPKLLLRWGTVGTYSEVTRGIDWRSAMILYRNLRERRAVAYEMFVRGRTDAEVPLREYGWRAVYRRPILGRDWLFGELIYGYAWPRERLTEARAGSYLFGFGLELLFGRETRQIP